MTYPVFVAASAASANDLLGAGDTSIPVAAYAGIQQGDLVLALMRMTTTDLTPPDTSWRNFAAWHASGSFYAVWYKYAGASEPATWTFTAPSADYYTTFSFGYRGEHAPRDPTSGQASGGIWWVGIRTDSSAPFQITYNSINVQHQDAIQILLAHSSNVDDLSSAPGDFNLRKKVQDDDFPGITANVTLALAFDRQTTPGAQGQKTIEVTDSGGMELLTFYLYGLVPATGWVV